MLYSIFSCIYFHRCNICIDTLYVNYQIYVSTFLPSSDGCYSYIIIIFIIIKVKVSKAIPVTGREGP
jgi:hypothetical protein